MRFFEKLVVAYFFWATLYIVHVRIFSLSLSATFVSKQF